MSLDCTVVCLLFWHVLTFLHFLHSREPGPFWNFWGRDRCHPLSLLTLVHPWVVKQRVGTLMVQSNHSQRCNLLYFDFYHSAQKSRRVFPGAVFILRSYDQSQLNKQSSVILSSYDQSKLGSNLLSYGQIELWYLTPQKIHSWRVVWYLTSQTNTFMKGGVIPYITKQYFHEGWCGYLDRLVLPYITKQYYMQAGWCGDLWKCGPGEVMTKGSGNEGKWWRMEVVTNEVWCLGKWWRREVATKGCSATCGCSCARSSLRLLHRRLQIAL